MYELFELVRLLSVRRQTTRQGPVEIKRFTWRENGECSLLVLLCSNDQLLVRWSVSGRAPVLKQLPGAPEKGVAAMCLDPTVAWLLVVTEMPCLYILPAVTFMDPSACVNQLWSVNDCTVIPLTVQDYVSLDECPESTKHYLVLVYSDTTQTTPYPTSTQAAGPELINLDDFNRQLKGYFPFFVLTPRSKNHSTTEQTQLYHGSYAQGRSWKLFEK